MKYDKPEVRLIDSATAAIQNPVGSKLGGPPDSSQQITVNAYAADE